ncbi:biotin carboxyl carrier protein of acetyl-CoA carboxylase 2, chloroplastic isoform X4 [Daucus carota subsp. sativus]|uniref:biotin carboxyl carrier protein of acetyl-CoA carboxylase 2, chloroplastic isoform X4 n=1 Tax=Daucus carota subsp. sativus TaxID=79200 RepID=UPI0007EF8263|nr:PREDICTED: biotin carboxyl carrier protein of acetyl-CoA carboxylase 2, chloroplastic-like isoform X2 [Daucus carota subsp. sativus]
MASFSVPCPKICAPAANLQSKPNHSSVAFRPDSLSNRAFLSGSPLHNSSPILSLQASNRNKHDVLRVSDQLNADAIPDASAITAFMDQVADLIELVDSRDIMELQLKQENCEVLIRKKEALPQPPAAPYVMMQSPSHQIVAPPQSPPAQAPQSSAKQSASPPAASAPPAAAPKSSHPPMKCPMAGTFYRCPSPGSPPFVQVGDKVQKGQVICIIEAMKLMNEIEAEQTGTIVDILVEDGKPVSVDLPLFVIEP